MVSDSRRGTHRNVSRSMESTTENASNRNIEAALHLNSKKARNSSDGRSNSHSSRNICTPLRLLVFIAMVALIGITYRLNISLINREKLSKMSMHSMNLRQETTTTLAQPTVPLETTATNVVEIISNTILPTRTVVPRFHSDSEANVESRRIIVLIANYRDSFRCAETLDSLFSRAEFPDLISISLFDQIYLHNNESHCYDMYCKNVGETSCRRHQLRYNQTIDADNATGPTLARYYTENGIDLTLDTFSLAIDSHLVFIPQWDTEIKSQWDSIGNPRAILTAYPRSTAKIPADGEWSQLATHSQLMCTGRIETEDADSMIQYGATRSIPRPDKPQLMSQFAGGFNFGCANQALEVRNDPYTPYLFHGEEYSKAARLFTHGYDMYIPNRDIVFHWYEKRNVIWEKDWAHRYAIQQRSKRRIRAMLGLPVTSNDYDVTDITKFGLGTKRSMKQFIEFSGIDPLAAYTGKNSTQFSNCHQLKYVAYDNLV